MKDISYDKLKAEVLEDIEKRKLKDEATDFEEIPCISACADVLKTERYEKDIVKVTTESKLIPYTEITGNAIQKFVKTLMKKLTHFFVQPLVDHQGDLNDHYADLFSMTLGKLQMETQRREALERQLEEALQRIDKLENMLQQQDNGVNKSI